MKHIALFITTIDKQGLQGASPRLEREIFWVFLISPVFCFFFRFIRHERL